MGATKKIKRILVSQPEPADLERSPYYNLITKHKVQIDFIKFISIVPVSASEFRKDKVYLQDHTAVIFTSRNAVDHFFRIAQEMRYEIPDTLKYFCISEATAYYLQKYVQFRKRKIFFGTGGFKDLVEIIRKHKEEKFLFPCSDIHKISLIEALDKHKINYTKAVIYKTQASDLSKIKISDYDLLVLFSPAGVQSLLKNFPDFEQNSTLIGAFGPATIKTIQSSGLSVNISAPTKTALSMPDAIEEYIIKSSKK